VKHQMARLSVIVFLIGFSLSGSRVVAGADKLQVTLEGPFVVCEETDSNLQPILRVIVPRDGDHYYPALVADGVSEELNLEGSKYTLKFDHKFSSVTTVTPKMKMDGVTGSNCPTNPSDQARPYLLSVTVPMPDRIRTIAPVAAEFTEDAPHCDDTVASATPRIKYATELSLEYDNIDLSQIFLCTDGSCSGTPLDISSGTGVGNVAIQMLQKSDDPDWDHHYHAKQAHKLMRNIAGKPAHCLHYYPDADMKSEKKATPFLVYHGHTDCKAVMLVVCKSSGTMLCK